MIDFLTHPTTFFVAGLMVGFVSGVITQRLLCRKHATKKSEVWVWMFLGVIGALYIASVIADIQMDGYATPIALHGLMGMATGYVLKIQVPDMLTMFKGDKK